MGTLQLSLQKGGGMRTPELARHSVRALLGVTRTPQANSRIKTDYRGGENFTHLKLTAEKLVQEQACAKTDLQIANSKLKKSTEQIRGLETKLQDVSNENAKLKVKQKEDAKLWKGLDSKLSSTKTLCDQLTETLQHLASRVQEAEADKKFLEEKLSERLKSFEDLETQVNDLSYKLKSAEETIGKREQDLKEIRIEKEQEKVSYEAEIKRTELLVTEKDNIEKQLLSTIEENNKVLETVQTQLEEVRIELTFKENACANLHASQCKLETDKALLEIQIQEYERKLFASESEKEKLRDEILRLSDKIVELEKISVTAANDANQLSIELAKCKELAEREKLLAKEKARAEYDLLNSQFQDVTAANAALQSQIRESRKQISELQESRDLRAKEYAEIEQEAQAKLHDTREKMDQALHEKDKLEDAVGKLQENIACLSGTLNEVRKDKEELIVTISQLKAENQDVYENAQVIARQKEEEIESLLKKIAEDNLTINLRENEVNELRQDSVEKAQLILQIQEVQKVLEGQNGEIRGQLLAAERAVVEIRRQCELQLEAKQVELTQHLKEISQRNDQEMNDIRRKCETETRESITKEKEKEKLKADILLQEANRNSEQRMAKIQEDALQCLQRVREDHEFFVKQLRQEHEKEKQMCRTKYSEEMKKLQQQFENELKEQHTKLMTDASVRVKDLHEKQQEEVQKLQEDQKMQRQKVGTGGPGSLLGSHKVLTTKLRVVRRYSGLYENSRELIPSGEEG
eukprot:Gb_09289 [translate_table: standard]